MKVSILCSNLSSNALGRAYLLAKVLQRRYTVEIVGPKFGTDIWAPCDDGSVTYKPVNGSHFPQFFFSARKLLKLIDGDIIYAVKPRLTSFGIGLLAQSWRHKPLILDIDDWDQQGTYNLPRWRRFVRTLRVTYDPYANQYIPLMERMITRADAVTVVSRPLQERFGGVYLPHGRDTCYLNPDNYSGRSFRESLKLHDAKIVMFLGTPRPHKGLEQLIEAIHLQPDLPLVLVIVGADMKDTYVRRLQTLGRDRVRMVGMKPFAEIPSILAASDIIALPQWDVPFAHAQVPAKVFDAMSMARPIVATSVGDLPHILDNCGIIVEPGNVSSLSEALRSLALNPDSAAELGARARRRCIELYSWDVMEETLESLFEKVRGAG